MNTAEIDFEDESVIAAAQARLLERRREIEERMAASSRLEIPLPAGVPERVDGPPRFYCAGYCGGVTPSRGEYCDVCAALQAQRLRSVHLANAYESISLGGALAWCRFGSDEYTSRVTRAADAARRIANPRHAERAQKMLAAGTWTRRTGNLVIIGPKRIGKTNLAVAIGHKILDAALAGGLDAEAFSFARGLRFMTGLDLARARADAKLGDEPRLISQAKGCSLLILDEIGFEDDKHDPYAVRDVIFDRYRRGRERPTIVTSGCTIEELGRRYGSAVERLTDLGELINLHPAGSK